MCQCVLMVKACTEITCVYVYLFWKVTSVPMTNKILSNPSYSLFPGGWPLVDGSASNWSINDPQFIDEKKFGSSAFFSLYVQVDDRNSSVNILQVRRREGGSEREGGKEGGGLNQLVQLPNLLCMQLIQSGLSLPSRDSYLDNRTADAVSTVA